MDYKSSGVDVEAGYKAVSLMKQHVQRTMRPEVISDIGGFGAMFDLSLAKQMEAPVLVSGTDGVGTKLKIAFLLDKHDTVGIDCVAMCVNDIICSGAKPLFFLDYIACGKNYPDKIASIVKGIADGCVMADASLVGGETAEMPDFYSQSEYDLAGFAVGLLDKTRIIDGSDTEEGDCIIGLASNGLHSNGFSLVRKVLRPSELNLNEYINDLKQTLGEELIRPTRIYVKPILALTKTVKVKGIANITGGGFFENIPRCLKNGLGADIKLGSWDVPPIFNILKNAGNLEQDVLYGTFNMGIGMILVVADKDKDVTLRILSELGEKAYVIGELVKGQGVHLNSGRVS